MSLLEPEIVFQNDYWKAVTSDKVEVIRKWSHHTGWCTKRELDARQYVENGGKLVAIYKLYPKSKSRPNFQIYFKNGVCAECKHRTMTEIDYQSLLIIIPELAPDLKKLKESTEKKYESSKGHFRTPMDFRELMEQRYSVPPTLRRARSPNLFQSPLRERTGFVIHEHVLYRITRREAENDQVIEVGPVTDQDHTLIEGLANMAGSNIELFFEMGYHRVIGYCTSSSRSFDYDSSRIRLEVSTL